MNVPLSEVERAFSLRSEDFEREFGSRLPDPDEPVVTVCMKGIRAAKARDVLRARHGYDNVAVYVGSFAEWAEEKQKET